MPVNFIGIFVFKFHIYSVHNYIKNMSVVIYCWVIYVNMSQNFKIIIAVKVSGEVTFSILACLSSSPSYTDNVTFSILISVPRYPFLLSRTQLSLPPSVFMDHHSTSQHSFQSTRVDGRVCVDLTLRFFDYSVLWDHFYNETQFRIRYD
jgi:hypothetical protein